MSEPFSPDAIPSSHVAAHGSRPSSSGTAYLPTTLNRRTRSLTLMRPLYDLDSNKGRYPELRLNRYDVFRLVSAVLDVIITEMGGFQRGATYEMLLHAMKGQLRKTEPAIDDKRCDRITSFILDALTNEKARDAFRLEYQYETQDGRVVWTPLIFKLVELRDIEDAGERYVASAEAINLYLSSLGVELEGQQAADEGALQHFIKHGKLEEAELAARTALMRTIEYVSVIRRALHLIERGVSDFDWATVMLPRLNAARDHIEERMKAEEALIVEAERKADDAALDGKRRLASIRDQLELACRQHNGLLNLVMGANQRFRDEHARQKFRPVTINPFPNPQIAVMRPILRMSLKEVDAWGSENWFLLHPPQIRPLPDFVLAAKALMQPKREILPSGDVIIDEVEEGEEPPRTFSDEVRWEFEKAFDAMPPVFRVSECFDRLPEDDAVRHLAILRFAEWFGVDSDVAEVTPSGDMFVRGPFYGEDLQITKLS